MNWVLLKIGGLGLLAVGGATGIAVNVAVIGQPPALSPPVPLTSAPPKPPAPTFANPLVAAQSSPPPASAPQSPSAAAPEQVEAPAPTVEQAPPPTATTGQNPIIRVRIASQDSFTIAVSAATTVVLPDGTAAEDLQPGQWHEVSVGSEGITIDSHPLPNGIKLIPPSDGFVAIAGRWYRGSVRLVWDGQLMAINEISLEEYLHGVVGAEMPPQWNPEALKAQAIAARSYALALMQQPPSAYWDIGNDERWQCYRGVETETNTTIAAVDDTRGLVVLRDNQIFLSQYASTDAISQAAHGGIGNSMSQVGAEVMASQGATMPEILARYYPGVSFGALE